MSLLPPPASTPRTAVVTGASSGIGLAYARALARLGHPLVLVARRADRLQDLAEEVERDHGVVAEVLAADLTDPADLARATARVGAGDVAVLVNNAGIGGYAPFAEVDAATVSAVNALNVHAPVALTHAAVPHLVARGGGAIVNVASMLAFSSGLTEDFFPARATYAAGKAYLVAFTRLLAGALAGAGAVAQVLCPGMVASGFHAGAAAPGLPLMAAEDVVTASLAALRTGEVICAPGLADPAAVDALAGAERALLFSGGTSPTLADRYRAA